MNDYENIKNKLFYSERYKENSQWVSSSWTGMFIFDLCKLSNSIVFETTPVRSYYLTDILDDIRDDGEYTIWTICTYEEGPDWLEIYDSRLKENYSKLCNYFYDEVKIQFSDLTFWTKVYLDKMFDRINETEYKYSKLGKYYSHNEIQDDRDKERKSSLEQKCLISERENYILNNCFKQEPKSHSNSENNWYSDPLVWHFMTSFENGDYKDKIQRIEFKYQGKLVRLYDEGEYENCYILDNWFNLDRSIFENWDLDLEK
ncbi:MAG: hypothetical protein P1U56_20410 [Saprospiraceae bacterium]|nr:hypothetical protein [Saprospiraceae bacterium]